MSKPDKLLTVEVTLQDLAEFSAAAKILGHKTNSAFIHQFMMQKILEARTLVPFEEFTSLVEEKKKEINKKSEDKAKTGAIKIKVKDTKQVIKPVESASKSGKPKKAKNS